MAIEVFNRYENKYLMDVSNKNAIQQELQGYMELDGYNKTHEFYTISNLYYDTDDSSIIRNSLSKPRYKEKLRLRAYGTPGPDDRVFMEIKKKFCGNVNKRRTEITLSDACRFAGTGQRPELQDYMNRQVIGEIEYFLSVYPIKPAVYVAYDRRAFFSRERHDLRITFDVNIRTRRENLRLESGDAGEPLLDKDVCLMEIKSAGNYPVWLAHMLSEMKVYKTSFSKYGTEYSKNLASILTAKGDLIPCLNPCLHPQPILQYQSQMQF